MTGSKSIAVLLLATIALIGTRARANGAFPDEFSVHFQPGAPHRLLVGANFGLLISEDDGMTWRYSCEPYITMGSSAALSSQSVFYYQVTADGAILADSVEVTRSTDVGCTWPPSGGLSSSATIADLFPDPSDASFVLAIVYLADGSSSYIVASHDGGRTFDSTRLYTTSDLLKGIEISKTTPTVAYATQVGATGNSPVLLRSADRGDHWTSITLPASGQTEPRILAIDPESANTVYLRLFTGTTDSIVITRDGGQTFDPPFTVRGAFTSFLRAGDGALYAGMADGTLYVRPAGKTTFEQRIGPHLRCLGQRPGTSRIYACGDMFLDGFSFGKSDDNGVTFEKIMSFTDLLGPLTCSTVATSCAAHWERIQQVLAIGGTDAGQPGSANDAGGQKPPAGGHCASAGVDGAALALLALLIRRRPTTPR